MSSPPASLSVNHQLHPLEVNASTGEPFLRVDGFDDIIITAQRWDDAAVCVPYMNDPAVHPWMSGPPLPYLQFHAERWMSNIIPHQEAILSELEQARSKEALITVGGCPVNSIRKVDQDGKDLFIGAIDISRQLNLGEFVPTGDGGYVVDRENKGENERVNKERELGDPDILWVFGDYLAPAYHGRGIMTACVATVLKKWAIPRMNVHCVRAAIFAGNIGSQKVFTKNGFKHIATLPDHGVVRGELKTLDVFEWRRA